MWAGHSVFSVQRQQQCLTRGEPKSLLLILLQHPPVQPPPPAPGSWLLRRCLCCCFLSASSSSASTQPLTPPSPSAPSDPCASCIYLCAQNPLPPSATFLCSLCSLMTLSSSPTPKLHLHQSSLAWHRSPLHTLLCHAGSHVGHQPVICPSQPSQSHLQPLQCLCCKPPPPQSLLHCSCQRLYPEDLATTRSPPGLRHHTDGLTGPPTSHPSNSPPA